MGLPERMQEELKALAPMSTDPRVVAPPQRNYSVWLGGSVVASLSSFQHNWISQQEYDEFGPPLCTENAPDLGK